MMSSIGLLHFTDLHVGMREMPADWPTIQAALFRDLEDMRESAGPWDLLVFTGDLVDRGGSEEFTRIQAFLERLWELFERLDCAPLLVAVPGNHDLARPDRRTARSLSTRWQDVRFRQDFWDADPRGWRRRVRDCFTDYERWWTERCAAATGGPAGVPALVPSTDGPLPGDFTATFEKGGVALGVLGLNTTFLQLSDDVQAGMLAVDKYQIQQTCDGDLPEWVARHDACLLVTHQPPEWLSRSAHEDLVQNVLVPAGPLLHLCGHLHEPEESERSVNGALPQRLLRGASLFGVEEWGTDREQRVHGYSCCRFDVDSGGATVHIWPRSLTRPKGGGLEFDFDTDFTRMRGSDEIEPIVVPRHPGARQPTLRSRAAVALDRLGLYVRRADDRDERLLRDRAKLARRLEQWLAEEQRKREAPLVRVLWLVGEDVPRRAGGMQSCLMRAGDAGRTVAYAGRDMALAGVAMEWCLRDPSVAPPVVGVELDAESSSQAWAEVRNRLLLAARVADARGRVCAMLLVAGDEGQAQMAASVLGVLAEVVPVDGDGRLLSRPYSFTGVVRSSKHVFNRGLPMTARKLFGRDRDLRLLREAWESPETRVMPVVAFGGTGKSALVNAWLREMEQEDYGEAARVLAWSFYSQGTRENLVSADEFVDFASQWLGGDEGRQVTLSQWRKGELLAELVKAQGRVLLVLDGVEPLQHPRDSPDLYGQLTDDAMRALLDGLARDHWEGLCVVTTRHPLTDLAQFEPDRAGDRAAVKPLELGNLDRRHGAELLEHLTGRSADFDELEQAVVEVGGHALALTLLGNYVRDFHGGDVRAHADIEALTVDEREGGHARRVMASYARRLREQRRSAELAVLNLVGLFDRPAEPNAMSALLAAGALSELTAGLGGVGCETWNEAVKTLQHMGLLNEDAPEFPGVLDAHPLVREHFREELRGQAHLWAAGNRVLYDHYRHLAPDRPVDGKWMGALYAAVTHGCAAGLHQRVFDEVLLPRVWHDRRTNYSTRRLGLTGGDLVALSNYFEPRQWTELRTGELTPAACTLVRTNAGVRLRQLGRLLEARECFGAMLKTVDPRSAGPDELLDASYAAAQSCELLVIDGRLQGDREDDLDTALASGRSAVEYSERVADRYFAMHARSSLAEVYFMLGQTTRAGELFEQAREIERGGGVSPQFLYSQSLYRYGYYLVESGRAGEIVEAERNAGWGSDGENSSLLSKAIRLSIGGAARRALIESGERRPELLAQTETIMEEATAEFRAAGYPDYIVRGLLERAAFFVARGHSDDYQRALADLDRAALETARGQMRLLAADVSLGLASCRLTFWRQMTDTQRLAVRERIDADLADAARLVEELGYGRRRGALAALQARARACARELDATLAS